MFGKRFGAGNGLSPCNHIELGVLKGVVVVVVFVFISLCSLLPPSFASCFGSEFDEVVTLSDLSDGGFDPAIEDDIVRIVLSSLPFLLVMAICLSSDGLIGAINCMECL